MNREEKNAPLIQKVKGATRDECIEKINSLYGSNYVLDGYHTISSRGFFGLGAKIYVEQSFHVIDSSNDKYSSVREIYVPKEKTSASPTNFQRTSLGASSSYGSKTSSTGDFLRNQAEMLRALDPNSSIQFNQVNKQLEKIQSQLEGLSQSSALPGEHKNLEKINDMLDENGFTHSYIKMMDEKIKSNFTLEELNDFNLLQTRVVDWIGENIKTDRSEFVKSPKVTVLIGPTGIGKTTTVAKMASQIAIAAKKNPNLGISPKILMISIDSMRVGAVDQLATYAEIIHAKVEQAETLDKLQEIYDYYADRTDYIFIDTGGYSPNDLESIAQLKQLLDVRNMKKNVYLTVEGGVSAKNLENIMRNYEVFNFSSLIVTKCDETLSFGNLLSVVHEKGKSISFITDGQEVVNKIVSASPLFFLKNLKDFKIDIKHLEEKFGVKNNVN